MAWTDNYNAIYVKELPVDETFTWQLRLEEHKKRGTLHASARLFKKTADYDGPTKNGFIVQITSLEDINKLQNALNELFNEAKEKL